MEKHTIGRAPNYTNACIVMFGVNLFWILIFLFAVWGVVVAVFVALAVNHWLDWLDHRKRAREQFWANRDAAMRHQ